MYVHLILVEILDGRQRSSSKHGINKDGINQLWEGWRFGRNHKPIIRRSTISSFERVYSAIYLVTAFVKVFNVGDIGHISLAEDATESGCT